MTITMWFGRVLIFLAIFSLSGLQNSLVQAYAWSTMLADRAPERGLAAALESTFSGDEPCCVCLAIAESDQTAPVSPTPEELPKLNAYEIKNGAFVFHPPASRKLAFDSLSQRHRSLALEIATPPPQFS